MTTPPVTHPVTGRDANASSNIALLGTLLADDRPLALRRGVTPAEIAAAQAEAREAAAVMQEG